MNWILSVQVYFLMATKLASGFMVSAVLLMLWNLGAWDLRSVENSLLDTRAKFTQLKRASFMRL